MSSNGFYGPVKIILIFHLALITSGAKLSREHDAYRLPRNYYPSAQIINLTYHANKDLKFEVKTTIYVDNVDEDNFKDITIHAYRLEFTKLEVSTLDGDIIDSYFEFVVQYETLIIHLETEEPYPKLKIVFEYDFKIKMFGSRNGVYAVPSYDEPPYELATMFQPSFARKVFPTFDDPYFRLNFTFSLKIMQDPDKTLDAVLFNTPLISEISNGSERVYEFEETVPLPAYLVAFAVLNTKNHRLLLNFDYFGIPIRFFQVYSNALLHYKEIREVVEQIVQFTLSYCESRFEIRWKISPKIDFVLTVMDRSIGGMENAGLITMSSEIYASCTPQKFSIR